ncbi:uncharacterized protein LOC107048869 [Diachasma alloeum]|uniref:uncharacterized protein LOC107048869 n=1 Tax=Diachasma alloeum TaxID=454923 RepID=UPI0007381F3D|nr:uncharacterized protein LOC107048869 [Diachasma alloeum]
MPTKHCAYASCNSDTRYPEDKVFFIPFPKPYKDLEKCKRWLEKCNRSNLALDKITKSTYICCKHFVGRCGPTSEHPDPIQCTESKVKLRRVNSKLTHTVSHDPEQDLPPKFDQISPKVEYDITEAEQQIETVITADNHPIVEDPLLNSDEVVCKQEAEIISTPTEIKTEYDEECQVDPKTQDATTETCMEVEGIYIKKLQAEITELRMQLENNSFGYDEQQRNESAFKFYTGFNYQQFDVLWNILNPEASNLRIWKGNDTPLIAKQRYSKRKISQKDQLFLTLTRLRCGFLLEDLSFRTGLSYSWISRIIGTWIQFLYQKFKDRNAFPPREITSKKGLPECFEKFKNLRVVVEVMEVSMQRPQDYKKQGIPQSANNVRKFLIGVVPTGEICFVSTAFGGSISDRDLFRQSNILEFLEEGDAVMAESRFDIKDLCQTKKCSLITLPLQKKREALTTDEVPLPRDIASIRLHIKKIMGRLIEYRILQRCVPTSLSSMMSQIVFVIAMLGNFGEPLLT